MSDLEVDLAGRAALVTGGGAGIGRSIALALGACGASVAVSDLNIERADKVADAILAGGGSAIALHSDISNRFQAANMIERTRDAFSRLDILVNAACIFHPEPMLDVDEWNWRRQIEVNITGAFFCAQLVARVMAEEGGGSIINLAPLESTLPAGIGYITAGAGLMGMTRQAARELAQRKIRVNCIAANMQAEPSVDVVGAALFLCSDAGQSITGQALTDDGAGSLRAWLSQASQ